MFRLQDGSILFFSPNVSEGLDMFFKLGTEKRLTFEFVALVEVESESFRRGMYKKPCRDKNTIREEV